MEEKIEEGKKEQKESNPNPIPSLQSGGGLAKYYKALKFILVVLIVVSLGLFSFNQIVQFRYKSLFIASPCELCKELNKNQSGCIDGCFKFGLSLYPDRFGNWKDSGGFCYDYLGNGIKCKN